MSDEAKGADGAPVGTTDGGTQESKTQTADGGGDQSVKFETYDKAMRSLSATKSERDELKERLARLEQEKLEAEGNKDQLIANLKKERDEYKTKHHHAVGSFALSQGKMALVDEAVKAGCNSPELLSKVMDSDLQTLDYGEDFRPDPGQIKSLVEKARKENPVLFSKAAPKVADHNLNTNTQTKKKSKPLSQMSDEELDAMWARANAGQL